MVSEKGGMCRLSSKLKTHLNGISQSLSRGAAAMSNECYECRLLFYGAHIALAQCGMGNGEVSMVCACVGEKANEC